MKKFSDYLKETEVMSEAKSQEELIKWYEQRLEKVKQIFGKSLSNHEKEKNDEYIKFAEQQLEAVKNGRKW